MSAKKIRGKLSIPARPPQIAEIKRLYDAERLFDVANLLPAVLEQFPHSVLAWNICGAVNFKFGKLPEAELAFRRITELRPKFVGGYYNLGLALEEQGLLDSAIECYRKALEIEPKHAEAYNNLGNAFRAKGDLAAAKENYAQALRIKPDYAIARVQLSYVCRHVCDWGASNDFAKAYGDLGIKGDSVLPFMMLPLEDDAHKQMLRSSQFAKDRYTRPTLPFSGTHKSGPDKLRIGYFSADFHDHATLYLMSGLLRQQGKSRHDIHAYSYGRKQTGDWRERLLKDVDQFTDVCDTEDKQVVELARQHGLDIAIDLKGYTQNTRSQLFAYRLAPVQINYLGYPGTMGADFIDYIVADKTVIPPEQRRHYTESVIYLPDCYQPNDDRRTIAATQTTRAEFGLPEDGFVFCCFNNNYKISPAEFDIWMRLLHQVEGSVLWLLRSNEWAEANLRREAEARGIAARRIVVANKLAHGAHLARHRHADLFIDTFNDNAHTTASDALWVGLPVVTKQGGQFAARVAASLLKAIGLPELITTNEQDYEALILALARDPNRLDEIKARLTRNRTTHPLFDTKRYTRHFEQALEAAAEHQFSGQEPADIEIDADN
jgi:predicted O-linked N-acetylglucosamine transferase (SPINDLY family)